MKRHIHDQPKAALTIKQLLQLMLFSTAISLIGCGGGGGGSSTNNNDSVDTTAPSLSFSSPRLLSSSSPIVLTFNESIDTTNFTLTGSLLTESNGRVWSQTSTINDTLTITPTSNWTINTNHTLNITVRDIAGNLASESSLTYDVYKGTLYYVSHSAADDSGDGLTIATAKTSILAAINVATAPATVVVNAGTYAVSGITLVEGVSLYGGYSADFTDRTANSSLVMSETSNVLLGDGNSLSSATIVDGFTLRGPQALLIPVVSMSNGAAPTIQNNTIQGTYGIYNSFSSPTIIGNTIEINPNNNTSCLGIINFTSSPLIQNNSIEVAQTETACNSSIGISNRDDSKPQIMNNIIHAGIAYDLVGIYNVDSSPLIDGNTINGGMTNSTGTTFGIVDERSSSVISNNHIDGGNGVDWDKNAGIRASGSDSVIFGNTISSSFEYTVALRIEDTNLGAPKVINNTLISKIECISEGTEGDGDPLALQFNNFKSCGTLYYDDTGAVNDIDTINAFSDITAGAFGNFISP